MQYVVSVRGGNSASVEAPNWLAALGFGLDEFGDVSAIDRLACEVLLNGTVLARDARTGRGYVVRPIGVDELSSTDLEGVSSTGDPDEEDSELIEFELPDEPGHTEEQERPGEDDSGTIQELPTSAWNPVEIVAPIEIPDDEETAEADPSDAGDRVGLLEAFDTEEDSGVFIDDDITDRFGRPQIPPVVVPGLAAIRDAVAIGPACEQALASLQAVVPCEAGSVVLRESDGRLRFACVSGPNSESLSGSVLPEGAGIAGFCMNRGTSLIVRRAARDPRFYSEVDQVTGFTTRSVLCVPVCSAPDTFGCIELLNPPPHRPFLGDDLRAAQDVAEALAACMGRERLHDSTP